MKIPTSYKFFKLANLEDLFNIENKAVVDLLNPVEKINPSDFLLTLLAKNMQLPMNNEKAKSELVITPILVEMWEKNPRFKPFSGMTFNVDATKGLKGRCDFLISAKLDTVRLDAPIVCVFEAKNDNLEDWYGQCGSEMYAAKIFNEQENEPYSVIYGVVTNGGEWQFLKLENNILFVDNKKYALANLPELLGAIQKVYDYYKEI
jgi:hypothetical protein